MLNKAAVVVRTTERRLNVSKPRILDGYNLSKLLKIDFGPLAVLISPIFGICFYLSFLGEKS